MDSCLDSNAFLVRINWIPVPSTSGSYGRMANEIQLDSEIFKILYKLNYLDFYFFDISAMLLIVLEVHFSLFSQTKV